MEPRVAPRRVAILSSYPYGGAASQRFRYEQYLEAIRASGAEVELFPFLSESAWRILYQPGHTLEKIGAVIAGAFRRIGFLLRARRFDWVFIHLEAAPLGPPIVEWMLFRMGVKVVYDIDDAIFISRTSKENRLASKLRWRSKVPYVTKHATKVTACNPYLATWARQFNADVTLLPTTIDERYHRRTKPRERNPRPVIGWTGTKSTLPYLQIAIPALLELQKTHDFTLRVISNADVPNPGLRHFESLPWRRDTEIADLETFDIGLMPVPDTPWEKGKVGFKAIQYGPLEIVTVASDVGSGREVVIDKQTGLLVGNDPAEWRDALSWLLDHPETWASFGAEARRHILGTYSVRAQTPTYLSLFE